MNTLSSLFLTTALLGMAFALPVSSLSAEPVKVYILTGQSNMEGKGLPEHLDTYKEDPLIADTYATLKDGDSWAVREDVWITYPTKAQGAKHGPLTVGYGTKGETSIGPEFGFGHTIGEATEGPVLLIKVAWGGKSIGVDFRPPGAGLPDGGVLAEMLTRARKKKPDTTPEMIKERYGHYYRELVRETKAALDSYEDEFPELKGRDYELAGLVWHQGFNDKVNSRMRTDHYQEYTTLLIQFIKDIRKDLEAPNLPFVVGELSTGGIPSRGDFQNAQEAATKPNEFSGNVAFVLTAEFYDTAAHELYEKNYWKGTDDEKAQWEAVGNDRPYHYLGSGKTYYLKGQAFAKAMLEMIED